MKGNNSTIRIWWDYVLRTKDWKKLKEYRIKKELEGGFKVDLFNSYKSAYLKDNRISSNGTRVAQRILLNIYGIKMTRVRISSYKKIIENDKTRFN